MLGSVGIHAKDEFRLWGIGFDRSGCKIPFLTLIGDFRAIPCDLTGHL